jgi:3-oxoacyl-(acyl-carrier-protein) synthase
MNMGDRVVITGMGTVNKLGVPVRDTRLKIKLVESGIGPITLFDASILPVMIAGEIKDFDQFSYLSYKYPRRLNLVEQLYSVASIEAMKQAGLNIKEINPGSFSVIVCSAIRGINSLQDIIYTPIFESPKRNNPDVIPNLMISGSSDLIAIENGFRGLSY